MRFNSNQWFIAILLIVFVVCMICVTATVTVAQQPEPERTDDRATTIKRLDEGFKPWIRSSDFDKFIHRLALQDETELVAKKQYKQQGNSLKQTVAVERYKAGFKKVAETKAIFKSAIVPRPCKRFNAR